MTTHRKRRPLPWWLGLLVLDTDSIRLAWHRVKRRREREDPWADSNLFQDPETPTVVWPRQNPPEAQWQPRWRIDPELRQEMTHTWHPAPPLVWPDTPVYRPMTTLALMQVRAAAGALAWLTEALRPVPPKLVVDYRMWLLREGITALWPGSGYQTRWRFSTTACEARAS